MIKSLSLFVAILFSPILFTLYILGFYQYRLTNSTRTFKSEKNVFMDIPTIKNGYATNWLFSNPYINTAGSELFRVLRRREIPEQYTFMLTNDDGGIFSIHVQGSLENDKTPTVMLFHGLCGGYYASYMKSFSYALQKSGFRVIKVNARGCADYKLANKIFFCATHTKDHKLAIDTVNQMFPASSLFAIGFSLGANVLLHYLEENPESPLKAAIGYSVAFDIPAVEKHLQQTIPKYTTNLVLASFIKQFLESNKETFDFLDWSRIRSSYSLQELDEQVVVKVFNYSSVQDYYKAAACSRCVRKVRIPFLVVNAEDDLVCPKKTIAFKEILDNPNVGLVLTKYGGHVGWAPVVPSITKDKLSSKNDPTEMRYFNFFTERLSPFFEMTNSWSEQLAVEYLGQF
eukprot:NODE_651_length_5002_cov_1.533347.p1 type:complete len:401 gc:universal NODE_651_length_5002_cov_1.533347:1868-666(-)